MLGVLVLKVPQALCPQASLWSHWVRNEEDLPMGWLQSRQ